jgi:HEAT repeat protein
MLGSGYHLVMKLVLSTFALLSIFAFQDEAAGQIEKLRSENIQVRETATKRLKELGASIRPALEKAAKDPEAEVSSRAAFLLRILDLKAELTPNLQKVIPDAVDRLASDADSNWTALFLEATATDPDGNRKLPGITRDDLTKLAPRALRGAGRTMDKVMSCYRAYSWRLKSGLPELEKLLSDPESQVRQMAGLAYGEFGGGAAMARIAEQLKDPDKTTRWQAATRLGVGGTKAEIKPLVDALADDDLMVRRMVLQSLGSLGDRSVIPTVAPLLKSKSRGFALACLARLGPMEHLPQVVEGLADADARQEALYGLKYLDARDAAVTVAKHLGDEKGEFRGTAINVLVGWRFAPAIEKIPEFLKDMDQTVRMHTVMGIGSSDDPKLARFLVPVLQDSAPTLRADAAVALGRLKASEFATDMAAVLKDADAYPRWSASLAFGRLHSHLPQKDRDAAVKLVEPLERDTVEDVRFAASLALMRMGAKDLAAQRDLLKRLDQTSFHFRWIMVDECVIALAQIHEKDGYDKLFREVVLKKPVESVDDLAALLETLGLKMTDRGELTLKGRKSAGTPVRPIDLIWMIEAWPGVILEKDSLRILPREKALEYWMKRLDVK